MSKPGAGTRARSPAGPEATAAPDGLLLQTFEDLRDELVSTLWFVLGNPEDAQDTAQETFLKCWRARDGLDRVVDLRAWIFRVALNAAKDLQRSAWHRRARELRDQAVLLPSNEVAPMQTLEERESLERIRQVLFNLRPEEKEVFLLRQNGDMTYERIAELRNCPVGTVKTQMRSALQKLRKALT
jgi:RNA polymerase sigma-70 factor (ECF subfamily)